VVVSEGQSAGPVPNSLSSVQAQALVERVLTTEWRTAQTPNHPMRYRLRKASPRLISTKEIVETRDGFVARLLSINDQPLSLADEQKEQARLNALLSDPGLQRHRKKSEDEDAGIVLKLLRMLPSAFLYQYTGATAGPAGKVEKFSFRPNPGFSPPDLETQALTTMTGELWIDATQERVTRLEGHLQQDTDYGWGILGRLNKGGWVLIEQADVGGQQWRIVYVQMEMSLRVLFKTRSFNTVEEMTQYSPVPVGLDYRQAIQMLRAGPAGTARASR
jgi:hypothetical protein